MSTADRNGKLGCSDCDHLSRRGFLKTTVGSAAAIAAASAGVLGVSAIPNFSFADEAAIAPTPTSETLVAQLYKSLKDEQRKAICFPFDHPLRSDVDNNWFIIKDKRVKELLTRTSRRWSATSSCRCTARNTPRKVIEQVEHDNKDIGGLGACSIAMFGEPGTAPGESKFEFVLTGRHTTRRCDGNSVAGAAFGGPIFYGHAAESFNEKPDHKGNVYWYQGMRANEVFKGAGWQAAEAGAAGYQSAWEHAKATVELPIKNETLKAFR